MESTQVIIVGAGPSGLVLALTLAQYHVRVCRHGDPCSKADLTFDLSNKTSSQ